MVSEESIAVTIQNYVQFYSIKRVIDKLITQGCIVDIFVPHARDTWGLKEMFDDIYSYLKKEGYNVRRKPLKKKYKILLEPYPMEYYFSFNYDYRLKYNYGLNSPKPSVTYRDVDNFVYDAILSFSTYEAELLSRYTKTYVVGKPNYYDFKRKKNISKGKKTLLYLPTYGESNSINDVVDSLYTLKKDYRIITKLHHGTNYFDYEESKRNKLLDLFDECYDSKKPLEELLSVSDVVLSDNSGAIFDAIYAKIPVAIFSKNIEYFKYENLEPYQVKLINDKIIPFTDDPNELKNIVKMALTTDCKKKQIKLSEKLFPSSYKEGFDEYIKILNLYINDSINTDAYKLHRIFLNNYNRLNEDVNKLKEQNNSLIQDIQILDQSKRQLENEKLYIEKNLKEYQNGKLYKISSKIYSLISRILNRR